MLTNLRRRTRLIMIIVAVGFIGGFLLGGTLCQVVKKRATGQKNRMIESGIVGTVGGHKITIDEYHNAKAYITDKYRQENQLRDLESEDYAQIEDKTWNFLISELTWGKLLKQTGIQTTKEEIIEIMKANPPEELRSNPQLLDSTGRFDQNKYLETMKNPRNQTYFTRYFQRLAEMLPKEKLRIDVLNSYRVTGLETDDALLGTNGHWKITSLYFGPQLLTQKIEPTDEEMLAYYQAHPDEFQVHEIRRIRYVKFPFRVTHEDSNDARELIDKASKELKTGESFNLTIVDFSNLVPETTSVLFDLSRLDKATQDKIGELKPGHYSKPYLTPDGWQIVMLDSLRHDTVALRRVLVRIKMGPDAVAAIRDSVRNFLEEVKVGDFDSVAKSMKLKARKAQPMIDRKPNLAGLDLSSPTRLTNWAKRARQGEVMDVPLRGPTGYYVFQLSHLEDAHILDYEHAKQRVSWRVRQAKEKEVWLAEAQQAFTEIRAGKTFEQYAKENPKVETATEEFDGIQTCLRRKGPEFAGTVLALDSGKTSGVIETNWGAFILRCDKLSKTGTLTAKQFSQQRYQQLSQQVLQGILKEPEIHDYRDPFAY